MCSPTGSQHQKNKTLYTYKLLKSGRSIVMFVSMATMLGTRELITEDLNVEENNVSHYEREEK